MVSRKARGAATILTETGQRFSLLGGDEPAVVQARASQDLPAGRHRVRHVDVAEGQTFQAEADAISSSLPQRATFTDRNANVVKIRMFHMVLMVAVARFFSHTTH